MSARHIVFVCSANICRSPSAEYYMKHVLERLGENESFLVTSCGVLGIEGKPADRMASKILEERGVQMDGHVSRGVDADEMARADLIVVMEKNHRAWFRKNMADVMPKVRLLREFHDGPRNLIDPIGDTMKAYRQCMDLLCQSIEKMSVELKYDR